MAAISHLKKIVPILEYIQSMNKVARVKYLKTVGTVVIKTIVNVIFNLNRGNFDIPPSTIDLLRPYKRQIKSIVVPKKSLEKRRKELIKSDFFAKIMVHILPLLLKFILPVSRDDFEDRKKDSRVEDKQDVSDQKDVSG